MKVEITLDMVELQRINQDIGLEALIKPMLSGLDLEIIGSEVNSLVTGPAVKVTCVSKRRDF